MSDLEIAPVKPDHAGVFDSPFEKWPGYMVLPDPDEFLEEHWIAWRRCLQDVTRREGIDGQMVTNIASALFVIECGEWQIVGPAIETLATPGTAKAVPMKLRRWLTQTLDRYMQGIMNPKA